MRPTSLLRPRLRKGPPITRKLSIVLAVVLAAFVASPNLGHAQGRGGGWRGGGWGWSVGWWGGVGAWLGLGPRAGLGPALRV